MRLKLSTWILLAAIAGLAVGSFTHDALPDAAAASAAAGYYGILSDIFLRLIKMVIAPLVFATVVTGIAGTGDAKTVGRIGGKAMLWFVSASLLSLVLGMVLANFFQPGAALNMPLPDKGLTTSLKTGGLNLKDFMSHVFPRSFFEAMANNEILQILIFSCFFGFALTLLKRDHTVTITTFIRELVEVMLKVTGLVMWAAPLGVFGAVAAAITVQGLGVLTTYAKFIGSFYAAMLILWMLLIAAGFLFLRSLLQNEQLAGMHASRFL
jgi:Na+/H+-dicarboxylate symporter